MITVDFVNKAITGIIDRFAQPNYVSRVYEEVIQENDEVEPEENHFFIENEIEILLQGLNIPHSVELVQAFDNPGIEIWVVCVAFFIDGNVESYNIVVESYLLILFLYISLLSPHRLLNGLEPPANGLLLF